MVAHQGEGVEDQNIVTDESIEWSVEHQQDGVEGERMEREGEGEGDQTDEVANCDNHRMGHEGEGVRIQSIAVVIGIGAEGIGVGCQKEGHWDN